MHHYSFGEKLTDGENPVITEAKAPGTFSLDKFLVNVAYPVETVTVYTNAYAANEMLKVRQERAEYEDKLAEANKRSRAAQRTVGDDGFDVARDIEEQQALSSFEDRIDALQVALEASALTIELRGMPPEIVDAITDKYFVDKKKDYSGSVEEETRDHELIAKSIIKITDADGNVGGTEFEIEDIENLQGKLLAFEYYKIVQATAKVNLNGALFDQATDASFLGGRSNVAGE